MSSGNKNAAIGSRRYRVRLEEWGVTLGYFGVAHPVKLGKFVSILPGIPPLSTADNTHVGSHLGRDRSERNFGEAKHGCGEPSFGGGW